MEQVMRVPGLDENKLRSLFRDAYLSSIPYYLLKVLRKRKFGLIKNIIVGTAQTMTS
jgi:hypothetical protein